MKKISIRDTFAIVGAVLCASVAVVEMALHMSGGLVVLAGLSSAAGFVGGMAKGIELTDDGRNPFKSSEPLFFDIPCVSDWVKDRPSVWRKTTVAVGAPLVGLTGIFGAAAYAAGFSGYRVVSRIGRLFRLAYTPK